MPADHVGGYDGEARAVGLDVSLDPQVAEDLDRALVGDVGARGVGRPRVFGDDDVLDGEEMVFTTWGDSLKGRNLRRNPRAAVVVDDEVAPYAFVHFRGHVTLSEDLDELLRFATAIGGRYMGADRAEEFGRRNAVPGELLVRLRPERVIAAGDVAG